MEYIFLLSFGLVYIAKLIVYLLIFVNNHNYPFEYVKKNKIILLFNVSNIIILKQLQLKKTKKSRNYSLTTDK